MRNIFWHLAFLPRRLLAFDYRRGLLEALLAERERWFLWLPVATGSGIAGYFLLDFEPDRRIAWGCLLAAILLLFVVRRHADRRVIGIGVLALLAGFALAAERTAQVAAPVLAERLGPVMLSGRVLSVAAGESARRLVLDRLIVERLAPERTPKTIRVTLRADDRAFEPGQWIATRAILLPPTPPQAPGAYDFPRQAYFQQLGAVGYAIAAAREIAGAGDEPRRAPGFETSLTLNELRHALTAQIRAHLPGPAGAIAAALLSGERSGIPDDINQAMQDSGLAHILSISGLHLAFVAGLVFFVTRLALAMIPALALSYPIKKWAALAALLAAAAYLALSGNAVPTQRAFIMTGVVLLAILLDRSALSMRLVAWAALGILVLQPESLLDISFQMSFAAVVALIAAYEFVRAHKAAPREDGMLRRAIRGVAALAATSLIAGLATAPFALYYFNRFVDYGLIANLAGVPLTGFIIMPLGLLALLLMPFGLEGLPLFLMGEAVELLIWIARTVAAWPGAVLQVRQLPALGLHLVVAGGLWLCLWRRDWRWFGLPLIAAGLASLPLAPRPDLLIDGEGKLIAVRGTSGELLLSDLKAQRLARDTWLRRDGGGEPRPWPKEGGSAEGEIRCDGQGCIYRQAQRIVALPRTDLAVVEDCRFADLVVSALKLAHRCPSARAVIDATSLQRNGAHAVYLRADGRIDIESVGGRRGERPWSRRAGAG